MQKGLFLNTTEGAPDRARRQRECNYSARAILIAYLMLGAIFRDYNFNRSINKSLRPAPAIRYSSDLEKKGKRKINNKEGKKRDARPCVRDLITYFRRIVRIVM